ncbi:sigma factor [Paenibacillus dendritiformis]|uniref:sigma factor n=1 Tax=Paenibacillus dendritiformis TaxID=130049 RepID=UPI00387E1075
MRRYAECGIALSGRHSLPNDFRVCLQYKVYTKRGEDMDGINGRIADVLAGNLHAFEEIYKQTIDQVYRTLYFLTDNTRELDDIVQEIYVELFRSLSAFDPSRSFPAWLYGITIRQHQAHRRKRWKQQRNDATERLASSERTEPQ